MSDFDSTYTRSNMGPMRYGWSGILGLWLFACFALLTACASSTPPPDPDRLEYISMAPNFRATDETGRVRELKEFLGRPLVLYFYPKDGTPGCTKEACAFRDAWTKLERSGAAVVGISVDDVASHAAFKRKLNLPFPLLSDPEGRVLSAYGVPRTPEGFASRTTFIIDRSGAIRRIFPEVDPALHVDQVLQVLAKMRELGL